jgi:hypothetical protein
MWGLQGLKKQRERERERRENVGWKKNRKLIFWLILEPVFSSLRP